MSQAFLRALPHLTGRLALLLGIGALPAAQASQVPQAVPDAPKEPGSARTDAGLAIRLEGGRVQVADGGGFVEVALSDTAEARLLRVLLAREPAAASPDGIRLDRRLLAGGGGGGAHWSVVPPKPPAAEPASAGTQGAPQNGGAESTGVPPAPAPAASAPPAAGTAPPRR